MSARAKPLATQQAVQKPKAVGLYHPPLLLWQDAPKAATIQYACQPTPLGKILVGMCGPLLVRLDCVSWSVAEHLARWQARHPSWQWQQVPTTGEKLVAQLFGQARWQPLTIGVGGTALQVRVWQSLAATKAGTTLSYGELAAKVGKPRAARAIGNIMNANPIGIIIPCHRVLAAGGKLGGFGWAMGWKEKLLAAER